ncbi:MAG: magnesium transporter CorA family protein [Odoribacter sp.]|nr:magnesium transporter CorA family protein [Odoribacter sp.]
MKKFLHCDNGFIEQDTWQPDCWVNIEEPDETDLLFLADTLGVPQSFMESLADADERPRVDNEDGWLLTILRVPMPDPSGETPFTTVPIGVMTNRDMIVTLCHYKTEIVDDFISFSQRRAIQVIRQQDFIMRLIVSATYWYLSYLKDINSEVSSAEKALRKSVQNRDLIAMLRIQKTLVYFNTSINGNHSLLERLCKVYADDYDTDLLEDLEIEIKQADNTVNVYSNILESTMDAYASVISNNINNIMKRMTSITLIIMVPTLIASLYGMNVNDLWLAQVKGSFFMVLGIAVLLTLGAYIWLRKIKWL